jgi:deazaflavin-dependent oxidoreductase (nitroreductase family)
MVRSAGPGGRRRVPVGRRLLGLHRLLYESTGGRLGHRLVGVPCLLLRTVGRRSGMPRSTVLVYARDGAAWLVVASNYGADHSPDWLHNLRARPEAEIQVARTRTAVTAHAVAPEDSDYPRLWALVNAANRGRYDHLAEKTRRPVPVVVLRPGGGAVNGHGSSVSSRAEE